MIAMKNYLIRMLLLLVTIISLTGCTPRPNVEPTPFSETQEATETSIPSTATVPVPSATPTSSVKSEELWVDVTESTIGKTDGWTNKVELADINGDGMVDLLFANGGDYDTPGQPDFSQVFLNQGPGQAFKEVTQEVFGPTGMLARVIKVRDVNNDAYPDILVGTTFQTQSQLYMGQGSTPFTNVTTTHLPQMDSSIGDVEIGDVDGDSDLDVVLADWGPGSPMSNEGGRTMLWLNDGTGHFSDATSTHMPDILVKFSWELEFVDIDNDYDLDILISCKRCRGSFLFENDGTGMFTDATENRLPQFTNNYDFEAMDVNGDEYLDLVTINDGSVYREHLFLNNGRGGFEDATDQLWPTSENLGCDDNMHVFLDFESDGDADLLIGSLECADRLLVNDGSGHLELSGSVLEVTSGTLGIAVADLNFDRRLDVVMAQGEAATPEKVFFGESIPPDTAPPVIALVETVSPAGSNQPTLIRARVHDNKSPSMPHDWQSITLHWTADGQTYAMPMQWYGEYLWRAAIDTAPTGDFSYQVCAVDMAGNQACSPP